MDAATKSDIESHIAALKTAAEGTDAEAIKQKSEELMKASHKLAEQMYAKTGAAGPGGDPGAGAGAGAGPGHGHEEKAKKPEEDVVGRIRRSEVGPEERMTPEGGGRGPVAQASRLWASPASSRSSYPNP